MKKIQKLKQGDKIGIFSSSSPTNQDATQRLSTYFSRRGFEVFIAPNTLEQFGYLAGLPEKRAFDFNNLIKDPTIRMIITANGGKGAIQMLSLVDYKTINEFPKIICGLSDPTTLLNSISKKCGIPTFHGPNGYNFGHSVPTEFTESIWWQVVTGKFSIPYKYPLPPFKVLKNSNNKFVEGKIFGGNLGVFMNLIGTPFEPRLDNSILFIEERVVDISKTDIMLNQLRLCGLFDKISALIIGQSVDILSNPHESFDEMILRNTIGYDFPIISNVLLGHTENKITIPISCNFGIDLENRAIILLDDPFID